jgi:hypothetical protein
MAQAALKTQTDERAETNAAMLSDYQKQLAEPHFWITFNRMGDRDKVDTVYIGAAGVSYHIRKGERVLLPHAAIQALKLAVREGFDHGNIIIRNGRKFVKRIRESEYSYTIEGEVSAAEAKAWRDEQRKKNLPAGDYMAIDGGDEGMIDVGEA